MRGLVIAGMLATAGPGCGGDESGEHRVPVSGQVNVDGKPLEKGAITFIPAARGPAAATTIENGTFAVSGSEGPGPGPYQVEIVSVQATGKTVLSPDDPTATIEESRNSIPARYNAQTQLQVEVKENGDNVFQFDLTSREAPAKARRRR